MKKLVLLSALVCATSVVQAQTKTATPFYGEVGYQHVDLQVGSNSLGKHGALSGILGYQFHPNFSAEIMLGTGISDSTVTVNGTSLNTQLDSAFGAFVRPSVKFSEKLEGFVRLGFIRSKYSFSDRDGSGSSSETSGAWGAGVNYYFTDRVYGQVWWTRFHDKDNARAEGLGVSVGLRF